MREIKEKDNQFRIEGSDEIDLITSVDFGEVRRKRVVLSDREKVESREKYIRIRGLTLVLLRRIFLKLFR